METLMGNNQKSESPSNLVCNLCGASIEAFTCGVLTLTPSLCGHCAEKQKDKTKALQVAAARRVIDGRLDRIIPPRCREARMSDLSVALVEAMTGLEDGQGLYLWGPVGAGKTWAMAALIRQFVNAKIWTKRVVWSGLLYEIKRTYGKGDSQESDVLQGVLDVEKLFIEDIGSTASINGQDSEFAKRTLDFIIDKRYEACLSTYITSNASIESLAKMYTERATSRIEDNCTVIHLTGQDRRKQNS